MFNLSLKRPWKCDDDKDNDSGLHSSWWTSCNFHSNYVRRAAVDTCKTPFPLVYFILSSYTPISSGDSSFLSNGATARSPSFSSHFFLTFSSSLGFFPMDFCLHLTTTNHKEVLSKAFLMFQSIKGSGTFLNSVNYHYSPYK